MRRKSKRYGALVLAGFGLFMTVATRAEAACSVVKEATVEAVFYGQKCLTSGKLTLNGVYYETDTGETLHGKIAQASNGSVVTVVKKGDLISPTFKGTLDFSSQADLAAAAIFGATGIPAKMTSVETRTGVQTLPAIDGRFDGAVTVTRDADAAHTTETRVQQGKLEMIGFFGVVTLTDAHTRTIDDQHEQEQTDLLLNGSWTLAGERYLGPLHITRTSTRDGGKVDSTTKTADGRVKDTGTIFMR